MADIDRVHGSLAAEKHAVEERDHASLVLDGLCFDAARMRGGGNIPDCFGLACGVIDFLTAQGMLAGVAVAIGIPLGLALFRGVIEANDSADEFAYPAWWWLALLAPAVIALVLAIAAPLGRRAAAMRVTDALRYE